MHPKQKQGESGLVRGLRALQRLFHIIITAVLFLVIILPIALVAAVISLFLRVIARLLARIFRPDLAGMFKGTGPEFTLQNPFTRPKLTIVANIVFEGPYPLEKLRTDFEQRILNYSDERGKFIYTQFRQYWTEFFGYIFWRWDPNFSVAHHIRTYDYTEPELALPSPCTKEDLKRVTNALLSKPFAKGKSPWEVLLHPNFQSGGSGSPSEQAVAIIRFHHGLGDGYSFLKAVLRLVGARREDLGIPSPNFPKISVLKMLWILGRSVLLFPIKVAQLAVDGSDGPNSWHLVDQKLSKEYHTFYSDPISMDDIKTIKNKYKVGYNTAAYSIAVGGIRRMMEAAGQKVPKKISCFAPFPLPNHPEGLVIHVSAVILNTSPRESAARRLVLLQKSIEDSVTIGIVSHWVTVIQSIMPVWIMRMYYNKLMTTVGLTSFPGPQNKVNIEGCPEPVDYIVASGLPPGKMGAVALLLSFMGKQLISLTVDKSIFESQKVPTNFAELVNDEVDELLGPIQV